MSSFKAEPLRLALLILIALVNGVLHGGYFPERKDRPLYSHPDDELRLKYRVKDKLFKRPQTKDERDAWEKWIDDRHRIAGQNLLDTATFFDQNLLLEGPEPEQEPYINRSFFRLRTGAQFIQGDSVEPIFRLRSRFHLPNLKKKVHLILDSATETFVDREISEDRDPFRTGEASSEDFGVNTALRWIFYEDLRQRFDLDIGARLRFPAQLYIKGRWQRKKQVGSWLVHFQQNLYAILNDDTGATSALHFHRPIGDRYRFTWRNRINGVINPDRASWSVGPSLHVYLGKKRALRTYVSLSGEAYEDFEHNDVGWAVHYRQNIWRPWMWLFIEPEVHFPRTEDWAAQNRLSIGLESQIGHL